MKNYVAALFAAAAAAPLAAAHTMTADEAMPFLHRLPRHVPPTASSAPASSISSAPASSAPAFGVVALDAAPRIVTDPQPFGDPVRVTWAGDTGAEDYIALSCGPQRNATDWLDTVPLANTTGRAWTLMLFDMRCEYKIALIDARTGAPRATTTVTYALQGRPTQLRVGPLVDAGVTAGVTVSFTTHPSVRTGKVRVLSAAAGIDTTVVTTAFTYGAADLCGAPASTESQPHFREPGAFHVAAFPDLPLGTSFQFEASTVVASRTGAFQTAPRPSENTTVLFAADIGTHGYPVFWSSPGANLTQHQLAVDVRAGASLVLHPGDVSYAVGHGYLWDQFGAGLEPVSSQAMYAVTVGNHEYDWQAGQGHWNPPWGNFGNDSFGECGVPTHARFPASAAPWYVLDWGAAKIVSMSSEHDWTPGSEQYAWLNATLGATDRAVHPWLIVTSHRPMYMSQTISPPNQRTEEVMRRTLDPLINAHGVDLFLAGHWHSAERSCPVQDGVCFGEGERTVHYTAGAGGCCLFTGYPFPASWDRAHFIEFSYLRLLVSPAELNVKLIASASGDVLDDYTMAKQRR
jgi:hypothetical protein